MTPADKVREALVGVAHLVAGLDLHRSGMSVEEAARQHGMVNAAIDHAILLARLAQAERDAYIANSDAGCEGAEETTAFERGRIAAFKDIIAERDRLRREIEEGERG